MDGSYARTLVQTAIAVGEIQCLAIATPAIYEASLANDGVFARHFQPVFVQPPSKEEAVEILEKTLIARAVERTDGNRSAASKLLGIHRNTLQRKMVQYGLGSGRTRVRRKAAASERRPRARKAAAG